MVRTAVPRPVMRSAWTTRSRNRTSTGSAPLRFATKSFTPAMSAGPRSTLPISRGSLAISSKTWKRRLWPWRRSSRRIVCPRAGKVCRTGLAGAGSGLPKGLKTIRRSHHHRPAHHLLAACGLLDGPVDVLAVGLELAEERRLGLVDVLGRDRDADRGAVFPGGLGELADDQGGGDRAVAADPELLRRLPPRLGLARLERHPQAVGLARERLLVAEAFGVEGGLVECLLGQRPEIVARADRPEADPQDHCARTSRGSPG